MLKTPGFYEYVARQRIDKKLGGVDRFAEPRISTARTSTRAEIDRNMQFLRKDAIETGGPQAPAPLLLFHVGALAPRRMMR